MSANRSYVFATKFTLAIGEDHAIVLFCGDEIVLDISHDVQRALGEAKVDAMIGNTALSAVGLVFGPDKGKSPQ